MYKNKEEVIAAISMKLMIFHRENSKGLWSGEKKDMQLEEMQHLADEWNIPFCWELHNNIMGQFVDWSLNRNAYDSWIASGCHLI